MSADVPAVEQRRGGLWRDRDFMKFWSAETFSLLGSQVSLVAIPLLAVTSLTASPFEMGVLNAAQFAPFLLLTLVAGVGRQAPPASPANRNQLRPSRDLRIDSAGDGAQAAEYRAA